MVEEDDFVKNKRRNEYVRTISDKILTRQNMCIVFVATIYRFLADKPIEQLRPPTEIRPHFAISGFDHGCPTRGPRCTWPEVGLDSSQLSQLGTLLESLYGI
ncbi:hypothetical protein TNCT_318731 [Trichonephila clavata]|uniref:Uncharacterized protein n=1 Tax=Trichonephila clavata TaxID=2740835 RepID=A0A8X6J2F8_TRICU|nr:hypothetical protein TNCT_318731 [Trichonephila clavata]